MAVIDLRENPAQQMAIAQGVGQNIAGMINSYRNFKMQQRVIQVLNDPNSTGAQKRQILLRDSDFLNSPIGQKMLFVELDEERRQQFAMQQEANRARINLMNAQAQYYQDRETGTTGASRSQSADLSRLMNIRDNALGNEQIRKWTNDQINKMMGINQKPSVNPSDVTKLLDMKEKAIEAGDERVAKWVDDELDRMFSPPEAYERTMPGSTTGPSLPAKEGELMKNAPMQMSGFGAPGISPTNLPGTGFSAKTTVTMQSPKQSQPKQQYKLEEPGRPRTYEEFEQTVMDMDDEDMAHNYYEKWRNLWP